MIPKDVQADILRLHLAEKWPIGTIARHLQVHHTTVERVLRDQGAKRPDQAPRKSIVDPYIPFMLEALEKYPNLRASRLYQMVRERGYSGGPEHFRKLVARHRPRRPAEAYHRLRTLPGEQAQVDWGYFGQVEIGRAKRRLWAFVMVLSWSRMIYLRFFYGAVMSNFLRGHVGAFETFGGVPRVVLYDNLKSAVIARKGDAIHFNARQLELAQHYRFEPRPVAPARGNEKGRVERAIRYVRDSFFEARRWRDLDDLNRQADEWVAEVSSVRPCPGDQARKVREVFEDEQGKLMPLPEDAFPCDDVVEVHVGKTPYIRFDLNDYSVPAEYARRTLVARATLDRVRVLDGNKPVAEHIRSWDRAQQIEDPDHIAALTAIKAKARRHRGMDRLAHAVPSSQRFLELVVEQGRNPGSVTARLLVVLDAAGAEDTEAAVAEALEAGTAHLGAVRQLVDRRRAERGQPPPVAAPVSQEKHAGRVVKHHALSGYDAIRNEESDVQS